MTLSAAPARHPLRRSRTDDRKAAPPECPVASGVASCDERGGELGGVRLMGETHALKVDVSSGATASCSSGAGSKGLPVHLSTNRICMSNVMVLIS